MAELITAENQKENAASGNPYVGPRTFRTGEILFGRDQEARDLTSLIIAHRLVLFYAPSGSGKSSLINTKIIPRLEEKNFEVLPVVRVGGRSYPDNAQNAFVYNIFTGLHQDKEDPQKFAQLSLIQFLDNLVFENEKFVYDEKYIFRDNSELKPRLLIIDQFEEILTTNLDHADDRNSFFEQLDEALETDPYLWVLLAMRDDFIAGLDLYIHFLPEQLRHRFYMQRLDRDSALEAVCRPATLAGRPFDKGAAELLVDNLRLIKGLDENAKNKYLDYVEPVQLQAVCYQMWEKLKDHPGPTITAEDVETYADVDMALTNFYEQTISATVENTGVSEIKLRNWFEAYFITEAGTRNMVHRGDENTGDMPTPIADYVRSRFILRSERRPEGVWYELVHDRLVQPILEANRKWRLDQPLLGLAQKWKDNGRSPENLLDGRALDNLLETNWQGLGSLVIEFVEESLEVRRQEEEKAAALEAARQKQEVEQAAALALAEKARADAEAARALEAERAKHAESARADEAEKAKIRQRWLGGIIVVMAVIGLIIMSWLAYEARKNARIAQDLAAQSQVQALASDKEAALSGLLAQGNAILKRRADLNRDEADKKAGEARDFADEVERQANANKSLLAQTEVQNLAEKSTSLPAEGHINDELGLLLGIEALGLSQGSAVNVNSLESLANKAMRDVLQINDFSQLLFESDKNFTSLAAASDGALLASGSSDGLVRVFDLHDRVKPPLVLNDAGVDEQLWVVDVAVEPATNRYLAAGFNTGDILIWSLENPEMTPQIILGKGVRVQDLAFSPDGVTLAAAGDDGQVRLWPTTDFQAEPQILNSKSGIPVSAIAYSPDSAILAAGDGAEGSASVTLWDLSGAVPTPLPLRGHYYPISALAFSPDGQTLASGSSQGELLVWNLDDYHSQLLDLAQKADPINALAFTPDGGTLAAGVGDKNIYLWDTLFLEGKPDETLRAHSAGVNSLQYLNGGNELASAGEDGAVRLWTLQDTNAEPWVNSDQEGWVNAVGFSTDGTILGAGADDSTIQLWNLEDRSAPLISLYHGGPWVTKAVFTNQFAKDTGDLAGQVSLVIAGLQNGSLWFWNLAESTEEPLMLISSAHADEITAMAYSERKQLLATGSYDGYIKVWDLSQLEVGGQELQPVSEIDAQQEIYSLAFSPDGDLLAAGGIIPEINIYAVANHQVDLENPILTLEDEEGPTGLIRTLAFSEDSSILASGGMGSDVFLWDLQKQSGTLIGALKGHKGDVQSAVFLPGTNKLATGGSVDNTIRIWDLSDLTDLTAVPEILEGNEGSILDLAYNAQNRLLASGSSDGTVRLWRVDNNDLIQYACDKVLHNLSWEEAQNYLLTEKPYHLTCTNRPIHPSVAEALAKMEADTRRKTTTELLQNFAQDPGAAENFIGQIPNAFLQQAIHDAAGGDFEEAEALLSEALGFDDQIALTGVGAAFAAGWHDWTAPGLVQRIRQYAANLSGDYAEVGAEFEDHIPEAVIDESFRRTTVDFNGMDVKALALIRIAKELDPLVDTSKAGRGFGEWWADFYWTVDDADAQILALAEQLTDADEAAGMAFKERMGRFYAVEAETDVANQDWERMKTFAAQAVLLDPQVSLENVGYAAAESFPIRQEINRRQLIEEQIAVLEAISPAVAAAYRQRIAQRMVEIVANDYVYSGLEDTALAAVDFARELDPDVDSTPLGDDLASNWSGWEDEDRLTQVRAYAANLEGSYPEIAQEFLRQIPQEFIFHATAQAALENQEMAFALVQDALALDPRIDLTEFGAAYAGAWNEWDAPNRLGAAAATEAQLASLQPEAASGFRANIGQQFLAQAESTAYEQNSELALELMREAKELDPQIETAQVGYAFASGLASLPPESLQEQIALVNVGLGVSFPEAASAMRSDLPNLLINQAYSYAYAGDLEAALLFTTEARGLQPGIDLSGLGNVIGQGWQDWDAETLAEDLTDAYVNLSILDEDLAVEFQWEVIRSLAYQIRTLTGEEADDEALALIEVAGGLDEALWAGALAQVQIGRALGLADSGRTEDALLLVEQTRPGNPDLDIYGIGTALADGWQNWEADHFGSDLNAVYTRIAAIDEYEADEFRYFISSNIVSEVTNLLVDDQGEQALALIAAVDALDQEIWGETTRQLLIAQASGLAQSGAIDQALALAEDARTEQSNLSVEGLGGIIASGLIGSEAPLEVAVVRDYTVRLGELDEDEAADFLLTLYPELVDRQLSGAGAGQEELLLYMTGELSSLNSDYWAYSGRESVLDAIGQIIRSGDTQLALNFLDIFRVANPDYEPDAYEYNDWCWFGGIWGNGPLVEDLCKKAGQLAPENGSILDSRGVMYAQIGEYELAKKDFEFFVDQAIDQGQSDSVIERRQKWIALLEQNVNPLTAEELQDLRDSES